MPSHQREGEPRASFRRGALAGREDGRRVLAGEFVVNPGASDGCDRHRTVCCCESGCVAQIPIMQAALPPGQELVHDYQPNFHAVLMFLILETDRSETRHSLPRIYSVRSRADWHCKPETSP